VIFETYKWTDKQTGHADRNTSHLYWGWSKKIQFLLQYKSAKVEDVMCNFREVQAQKMHKRCQNAADLFARKSTRNIWSV